MSNLHHTDIAFNAGATVAAVNSPLGQLDQAIEDVAASGSGWAQTLDGTAASGQKVVPVTDTTGSVVGMPVFLGVATGNSEVGVIASIQAGVSVTLVTNLTYTYSAGAYVTATPYEVFAARAAYATMAARLAAMDATDATAAGYHSILAVQYIYTGTGTYTPTAGASVAYVEAIGGGGAGGGVATAATNSGAAGGGGGGAYSTIWLSSLAASYAVAVGAGGAAGAAGGSGGGTGGDTTFGSTSICTAKGGTGGSGDSVGAGPRIGGSNGSGGSASSGVGDFREDGSAGLAGMVLAAAQATSGGGGSAAGFGGGSRPGRAGQGTNGSTGCLYGGGGSGGCIYSGGASVAGTPGAPGVLRITEYR